MNLNKSILIFFSLLSYNAFALKVPAKDSKVINSYSKIFQNFVKQNCRPGYEFKYQSLNREYRGNGIYYPMLGHNVDYTTISKNLDLVTQKKEWIQKQIKKLKNNKKLPKYSRKLIDIQKKVDQLLELKRDALFYEQDIEKNKKKSKKALKELEELYDELINNISYLTNFSYPVDHLKNRQIYDNLKGEKNKQKANDIFFFRKLVEDGTLDSTGAYPDMFVRTTLDTIKLAFKNEGDFLSEDLRYDIEWVKNKISKLLSSGRKHMIKRLLDWEDKTQQMITSYETVLKEKNSKKKSIASKILADKDKATEKLIAYVYPKQAKVYRFWLKQNELNRALYVLTTILFNEVGDVDPQGLEREDVLKIVLNRKAINYYRKLHPRQRLSQLLGKKERDPWLNLLFRRGEFSFTYYFIPSVKKIFCPDMSPRGRSLRRDNLKIALEVLRSYKKGFEPTRYFSRHSMIGKVDMAEVWAGYHEEPEKAGKEVSNPKRLLRLLKNKKFRYLYSFEDKNKVKRHVLEFEGNPFVVTIRDKNLYQFNTYRNPHYFAYFTQK